jgi:hypothetical protein
LTDFLDVMGYGTTGCRNDGFHLTGLGQFLSSNACHEDV